MTNYKWRIQPPDHMGHEVRKLALAESRSDTAMLTILIAESLAARRKSDIAIEKLVSVIKGAVVDTP